MNECYLRLPVKALAVANWNAPPDADGRQNAKVPPMVGDPIDISLRGTVTGIENGVAKVHVVFVNGDRVNPDKVEPDRPAKHDRDRDEDAYDEDRAKLRGKARRADDSKEPKD